jgi:metal-responsive CopG/Arc/MetJ family transcriptional regulator
VHRRLQVPKLWNGTLNQFALSREVLARIDRLAGSRHWRSAFIERVLRRYLLERERAAVQARDLERINHAADRLNSEAADAMEYQTSVE